MICGLNLFSPKTFDFEVLQNTWGRLAHTRDGELINEKFELDFVFDYKRVPFEAYF